MTYTEIKGYLRREDLVCILESLGYEFTRQGSFAIREEKTPSTTIRLSDLYIKDHGGDFAGDIFDLLKKLHGMTSQESREHVMGYLGLNGHSESTRQHHYHHIPKLKERQEQTAEEENQLIKVLEIKAQYYLTSFKRKKWNSFLLDNEITGEKQNVISLAPIFEKLFEALIIPTDEKFAKYLFEKIIGYDSYFNCPVIIVRNEDERVVDIVRYRPEREGKALDQKYLVTKNIQKPDKRGRNFVFPFQQQMMLIAHKENYCFVGEGLKNAVNASLMGIPFISIESSSNIDKRLINFLNSSRMQGISLIGALDGDEAGKRAYRKLSEQIPVSKNMFDFKSGIDFTDYLKGIREELLYGSKKAS